MVAFEVLFGVIFEMISIFIIVVFFITFFAAAKNIKSSNKANISSTARKYDGITRAGGSHYHKGSVGTTRKDEEWEETRCGEYKDEIFGKDVCNTYTQPDYDSLSCEDEDLSGR